MRMHEAELDLSIDLVGHLLRQQCPDWLGGPIRRVASHGTVNAMFRVRDDFVCRLPLVAVEQAAARSAVDAEIEAARVFSAVDIETPELVFRGDPSAAYPMPWTVWRWIDGDVASDAGIADDPGFAEELAAFVVQIRELSTAGRSFGGDGRGGPIADETDWVERCLRESVGMIDTDTLGAMWQDWRGLVREEAGDTWTHNDLMPGNLLVRHGGLAGVIDVGQAGVADPAVDLQPAWNLFEDRARSVFRSALAVDDEQWERGRAWSFIQAIGSLWYYRETNPEMSRTAYTTLTALLGDG